MKRRTLLSIAGALASSLVLAPAALATFPGDNGLLLYQRDSQIWTSNPDGTGERPVTHTNGESGTWSPDGRRIAFDVALEPDSPSTGLWTVRRDGTERTKLEVVPPDDFPGNPAWTRDGRSLMFNGSAYLPSPPWRQYAVGVGIRAIDRDGGNERWVMIGGGFGNGVGAPLPSPTSDTLALASGGAIEFFDPRTGASRWYRPSWPADHPCSLHPSTDPCSLEIGTPSWSPDGKRLIFSSDCRIGLPSDPAPCPGESAGMSILDVETLERRTLPVEGLGPVWSPDGRKIAFWRTETDPPVPGEPLVIRNTIHVMNADGTDVREVAEGTDPDWQAIPRSDEPAGPSRPPGPPPHRPPVRPNPPAPPSPPPAHVPDGTPPGQPTGGSPSFPEPVPSVGKLRISVRAPLRARAGRSVRLVVRFSRPLTGRVRLQERRGKRLVTVAGKTVRGKRVTFAVRPRAGTRVYRIVHATRAKVVRIRVR